MDNFKQSNIVSLADRKKSPSPPAVKSPPVQNRYYCLSCDTDRFLILATGIVYCACCGALMQNLFTRLQ